MVSIIKLQALVYDMLPSWRKVPEGDARSVQYHLCKPVDARLTEGPKLDGLLKIQTESELKLGNGQSAGLLVSFISESIGKLSQLSLSLSL